MLKRVLLCSALAALAACDNKRASEDAPSEVQVAVVEPATATPLPVPADIAQPPATALTAVAIDTPPQRVAQQPRILEQPIRSEKPRQVSGIYTPPPGSAERVALMNALRGHVRDDIGGEPVFVVRELRSDGQWAFAQLDPQWRDGTAINIRRTPYYQRMSQDQPIENLNIEVIWRNERGRWQVFAHNVAATDVWWLDFCNRVPHRVLGRGC